jgi:hypothetical protein
MTSDYSGLRLYDKEAVAGGPASKAIVALGKHLQDTESSFKEFRAFDDAYHVRNAPDSWHTKGLAFDAAMGDVGGSQQRMRAYLKGLGLTEGDLRGHGDFGIEYWDKTHLHTQFSREGAARYLKAIGESKIATNQVQHPEHMPAHPPSTGGSDAKTMTNRNTFQHEAGMHIKISNPAGASVNTQMAMLGAVKGTYS